MMAQDQSKHVAISQKQARSFYNKYSCVDSLKLQLPPPQSGVHGKGNTRCPSARHEGKTGGGGITS
jgi:hypothetical protein